jgi:hypothetical protein
MDWFITADPNVLDDARRRL